MSRVLVVIGCLAALTGVAAAQTSTSESSTEQFNPSAAVAPISVVEGPGVKVGEGTVLHPVFGVETGFISNVFYDDNNPRGAGLLRLMAQIGTASLSDERLAPADNSGESEQINEGSLRYRASLRLSYDQMLSDDDTVRDTGGLGVGGSLHGMVNPQGRWSFAFDEDFLRLIRATNYETDVNTNRDINTLRAAVVYHPLDRSVHGSLYYQNILDFFESSDQRFANRQEHRVGLRPAWRWFPRTQLYADLSWGFNGGLGGDASRKVSSYPLVALAGVATLLTVKTTLNFEAGYTNGFYSSGPSYSAPVINAQVGYRFSPLGRVALLYSWLHQDSINANFYRDHIIRGWWSQALNRVLLMVQPEAHFRRYDGITLVMGPPTRDDVIVSVIGGASYNFRNWIAATLNYRFTSVLTDYEYMFNGFTDVPTYARHEVLLGIRVAK